MQLGDLDPEEDHEHPVCCPVVGELLRQSTAESQPWGSAGARNSAAIDGGGKAIPWLLLPTSAPCAMQTSTAAHPKDILLKQLESKEAPSVGEEHQS